MGKPKPHWGAWHFTVKTLPAPVYAIVTRMKGEHGLSSWQTVILALLALEHVGATTPEKVKEVVAWVKEKYPDGKDTPGGKPW